jgi:hypothetical protein
MESPTAGVNGESSIRQAVPAKGTSKRKFKTDITESTVNSASEAILGGLKTQYECSKC